MQTPIVKGRMDLVEEELINMNLRFIDMNERFDKKMDEAFDKVFKLLQNLPQTPNLEERKNTIMNTEMKSIMEEEVEYKPSKRDRESISSLFTTEPITPVVENIKQKQKDAQENNKPDFIADYEKSKSTIDSSLNSNNLIQEIVINESSKYNSVSLKTIKLATDKLQLMRTENPQGAKKLKLAYFFSQTSMDQIYNKQIAIKGSILQVYENPTRLYLADDDVFLKLLCDTIRPVSAEDHLSKLLQVIQLDYINAEFEFKDFHKQHLPKAMHQLNKLKVFDSFIRYMASTSDLNMLILNGYGKEKAPQMTRVILAFFGTLQDRLIMGITEEKLKKMQSPTEVFTAIHKYLTKLANQAHEYELDENAANTCPNILSAFSKLKKKSYENVSRERFNKLKLMDEDDNRYSHAKKTLSFEDDNPPDDDAEEEEYINDVTNSTDDSDEEALMFVQQSNKEHIKRTDTSSMPMPCYKILFGKVCEDGNKCKYSHDKAVLTKHVSASLEKWSRSPFASSKQVDRPSGHPNQDKFLATRGHLKLLSREQFDVLPSGDHN